MSDGMCLVYPNGTIFGEKQEIKQKEPFCFEYTTPSLDWYETIRVEVNPESHDLFRLQLRHGNSWWLIGEKCVERQGETRWETRWETKELGRISDKDIFRFLEWAKNDIIGNRIVGFEAISSSLDLWRAIEALQKSR